MVVTMDTDSPADELPALYRAILDQVAWLESLGERAQAAKVRSAATRAYSRAWDARAKRRLEQLLRQAQRPTGQGERPSRRSLGRRLAPRSSPAAAHDR
jgi:hypothetical protein